MRVSVLGTGLMGRPMAERLLAARHTVTVWNRTRERAAPLALEGARVASTPAEAARAGEAVVLMLADMDAIRGVLLKPDCLAAIEGRTVIQMGTIAPAESLELKDGVNRAGGDYLEAPVLGSTPEAREGRLIVMAGGGEQEFLAALGVLKAFSPMPRRIGPVGSASALKLAFNQLIAAETAAFALSLGFVRRSKVNVDVFLELLRASALYAPTFDKKLARMLDRKYEEPNFPVAHLAKDVDLFLETARRLGLDPRGLVGVRHLLEQAPGPESNDYSALYDAVDPRT